MKHSFMYWKSIWTIFGWNFVKDHKVLRVTDLYFIHQKKNRERTKHWTEKQKEYIVSNVREAKRRKKNRKMKFSISIHFSLILTCRYSTRWLSLYVRHTSFWVGHFIHTLDTRCVFFLFQFYFAYGNNCNLMTNSNISLEHFTVRKFKFKILINSVEMRNIILNSIRNLIWCKCCRVKNNIESHLLPEPKTFTSSFISDISILIYQKYTQYTHGI